jgi:hypothetical protein
MNFNKFIGVPRKPPLLEVSGQALPPQRRREDGGYKKTGRKINSPPGLKLGL